MFEVLVATRFPKSTFIVVSLGFTFVVAESSDLLYTPSNPGYSATISIVPFSVVGTVIVITLSVMLSWVYVITSSLTFTVIFDGSSNLSSSSANLIFISTLSYTVTSSGASILTVVLIILILSPVNVLFVASAGMYTLSPAKRALIIIESLFCGVYLPMYTPLSAS